MDNLRIRPLAAPLAHRLGAHADAAGIAEAMGAVWHEIDGALSPIIGARGVAALLHRSLLVASERHVWLLDQPPGIESSVDVAGLTSRLAQQSDPDAAAGGSDLLEIFHDLLTTLIGRSLTERLLRAAWGPIASGDPVQEAAP